MSNQPMIHVAVVGHTNTGKTSLLRTLTRDRAFGEVADAPGTTRNVQSAVCWLDGEAVLSWYDTPGLEDSIALRDWIESLSGNGQRLEGSDRVELFLQDKAANQRFEQESRVLRQVVKSDAVLYVIDTRDPVLPKHRDELFLLNACARPLLPVLNFTASSAARAQPWVQALARLGLHIHLRFDTVTPPIDGEALVFQTLAQLLSDHQQTLERLASDAQRARQRRHREALQLIGSLVVDVAATLDYSSPDDQAIAQAVASLHKDVAVAEQRCVDALLVLFQFGRNDYLPDHIAWSDGQWHSDPFSAQAIGEVGLHLSKGAAAGALAGAAVDVMTAGLTLGSGTLIGAAAGTAWQGLERWGQDLLARVKGERPVGVSDEVLLVLAMRQLQLLDALEHRGHAAQGPVRLSAGLDPDALEQARLLRLTAVARRNSSWSAIRHRDQDSAQRQALIDEVAGLLDAAMQHKLPQSG